MTETEWLTCTDPVRMLHELALGYGDEISDRVTDRKLRLLACACCRVMGGECCRQGGSLDMAEDFADGMPAMSGAWATALSPAEQAQTTAVQFAFREHSRRCAAFLRDIFGNPYRPESLPWRCRECGIACGPPAVGYYCVKCGSDEACCPWLTWNERTVPKLAQAIYDERAFDRMPILADALEEAGCANEEILMHCRGHVPCLNLAGGIYRRCNELTAGGVFCSACGNSGWQKSAGHVRGCWVLDCILGKE